MNNARLGALFLVGSAFPGPRSLAGRRTKGRLPATPSGPGKPASTAGCQTGSRLAALLLAAVTCGCYEASVPLGPPGAIPVDAALVGTWQCAPPPEDKSDSQATLVVMPFDEAQYVAEWSQGKDTDRYRAYASRAGSQVLLNVRALEPAVKQQAWVFMRYRIDAAGRLNLAVVRDKALEGLGEREALEAIRSRAADDSLYEPPFFCTRTRD